MVEWLADAFPDAAWRAPGTTTERADTRWSSSPATGWTRCRQVRMHRDLLPEGEADPRSAQRLDKLESEVRPQLLARFDAAPCGRRSIYGASWSATSAGHGLCLFRTGLHGLPRRLAERKLGQAFDDVQRPQQSETSDAQAAAAATSTRSGALLDPSSTAHDIEHALDATPNSAKPRRHRAGPGLRCLVEDRMLDSGIAINPSAAAHCVRSRALHSSAAARCPDGSARARRTPKLHLLYALRALATLLLPISVLGLTLRIDLIDVTPMP